MNVLKDEVKAQRNQDAPTSRTSASAALASPGTNTPSPAKVSPRTSGISHRRDSQPFLRCFHQQGCTLLLLSPLPSLPTLSWLLALDPPMPGLFLVGSSSTPWSLSSCLPPSLTTLAHDVGELLGQNSLTWLGSAPHLADMGTQLQQDADAVTHLAYICLKLLV